MRASAEDGTIVGGMSEETNHVLTASADDIAVPIVEHDPPAGKRMTWKRWAILPGLITEAIPGMGIFPVWVLVVASIAVYDDIHKPHRKLQRVIEKISR